MEPNGVAVSPDGSKVYVANFNWADGPRWEGEEP
jgi:DNA-binding beta-propeller fold protein YncE